MAVLEEYEKIIGSKEVAEIKSLAEDLKGKRILIINSTKVGGGVAELLKSYVPLMNDLEIHAHWITIPGNDLFFSITKKIHNSLQGGKETLSDKEWEYYLKVNEEFAKTINEENYDMVIVHDPQPLASILFHSHTLPWILRLHIDLSSPNRETWDKMLPWIKEYDHVVVSSEKYANEDINSGKKSVIMPAIDPLSPKNIPLSREKCSLILEQFKVDPTKPIMAQVSRFDKWKDPLGVIDIFEIVKKKHKDLQLILLGGAADDDPEGMMILEEVRKRKESSLYKDDIHTILFTDDYLVNAVQRLSDVVIQKSIKEGFGLVVSEAMYKNKAVVGSDVTGIAMQIDDGLNGFLVDPYDYNGFAEKISLLLRDKELREELGKEAHKKVKENFLITRLLKDWIMLMREYIYVYE